MLKLYKWIKNVLIYEHDKLSLISSLLMFIFFAPQISQAAYNGGWDETRHYASLFNWASIQTAFLFGIYTFIIGRPGKFKSRFEKFGLYNDAMKYLRRTVFYSFTLSFSCLPLMFVSPNVGNWSGWSSLQFGYILFAASGVTTLYIFGRILISMKIFMFVEKESDELGGS